MRAKSVLSNTLSAYFAVSAGMTCRADSARPNVLIILTDDMRFDQMTCAGHPYIQTPNLDRLAHEGMRFTQAYVPTPLCGPSRMSILSGRLPSAHGRVDNFYYPKNCDIYFPKNFHDQGYRTAMIGKYYEGGRLEKEVKHGVYDFWFKDSEPDMKPFGGRTPEFLEYRKKHLYYDQYYEVGDVRKQIKGYQTDILFDQICAFATEKPEQPFMAFMSTGAPHAPFNPSPRRKGKYAGKGIPMKDNIEFGVGYMTPARVKQLNGVYERTCEMIEDIDEGVGRLLNTLEKSGQLDHTVIIFTSDNGVMYGEHGFAWKRHPWQESLKVPLIIRYPKIVPAGSVCDAPVTLTDLFPTCAELTGVQLPDDDLCYGKSLVPVITGQKDEVRANTLFMQYEKGVQGKPDVRPEHLEWVALIRSDGWKLIRYRVGPPEVMHSDYGDTLLFNLKKDPMEMNNLADHPEYRDLMETMKMEMKRQLKENQEEAPWL